MKHELLPLPYAYDALEPHIDARTMEIHHAKHHQAYVDKLNEALDKHPELSEKSLEDLIRDLSSIPEDIRTAVRNNGGGHLNHSMFWPVMGPSPAVSGATNQPSADLMNRLELAFGDYPKFREQFSKTALECFGSGWAWLVLNAAGKLAVTATGRQDNPISEGLRPLLGLDVWEHAYYLKYQNRRKDYIEAWWNVVNWAEVEKNLLQAQGTAPAD